MLATLLLLSPLQQSAPICSSSDIPFDWTQSASMSIDGNLAAVGQGRYQDGSLPNFVSLLEVDELGCWNEVERLFDPTGSPGWSSSFGTAVALDGDRLLVGDRGEETVTVYSRDALGVWAVEATLQSPYTSVFGSSDSNFGIEVALEGDTMVVGASGGSPPLCIKCGVVLVYERNAFGFWNLTAELTRPSDFGFGSNFGGVLDFEGDTIVAASNSQSPNQTVWAFRRDSNGLWDSGKLLGYYPSIGFDGLDLDGQRVAIGIPSEPGTPSEPKYGRVRVLELLPSGGFVELDTVVGTADTPGLGQAVAMEGDVLMATTPGGEAVQIHRFVGTDLQFEMSIWIPGQTVSFQLDEIDLSEGRGLTNSITLDGYELNTIGTGPLYHGAPELSVSGAGFTTQSLSVREPSSNIGDLALIFGSTTGVSPGLPIAPGVEVPLVPDAYTNLLLAGGGPVQPSILVLDASGSADTAFQIPVGLPASAIGLKVHHAAVLLDSSANILGATNATTATLVP
jgi:hypothetical protein